MSLFAPAESKSKKLEGEGGPPQESPFQAGSGGNLSGNHNLFAPLDNANESYEEEKVQPLDLFTNKKKANNLFGPSSYEVGNRRGDTDA